MMRMTQEQVEQLYSLMPHTSEYLPSPQSLVDQARAMAALEVPIPIGCNTPREERQRLAYERKTLKEEYIAQLVMMLPIRWQAMRSLI